jgi:hypothetical protein
MKSGWLHEMHELEIWKLGAIEYLEFEVLLAVVMKISILWDITPCSPLKS